MMRYLLGFILIVHGLIHLIGFAKAFHFAEIPQLTRNILKPTGLLWLLAVLLFIASGVLTLTQKTWWPLGLAAVLLSQALLFSTWQDAKFGTIANAVIFIAAILAFGAWRFENGYIHDVRQGLQQNQAGDMALVQEEDIQHLPSPVQGYLRYAGVIGKPEAIDDHAAKAVFTCNGISVSAILYFNDMGQLTNFISDDRYDIGDKKSYRFSTPVGEFTNFKGSNVVGYGEAVWHYPEGEFVYGKFKLKQVEYNVGGLVR